jgi:tripeptide aminopeptidase
VPVTDDGYTSELARELAADALERFLRYARIDTQSDGDSTTSPSTAKQLDLSRLLVDELGAIGLEDAQLDEHGYVFATLPATTDAAVPTIGLVAHVDTSPAVTGAGVRPLVHRYEGGDLPLPGDASQVLSPEESPDLANHVGHDIVTSDGTTLLGADDKAGVAEIVAAAAYLVRHPELPRPRVRIAFTPDEEIGEGTRHFDLAEFGADVAYTLDGSELGEIQDETFSASKVVIRIRGRSVHPGDAKGVLVNAVKLGARLLERLPQDSLSPETTDERQGYVHPDRMEGDAGEVRLHFIVRDFDRVLLEQHEALLRGLADQIAAEEPRAQVSFERRQQYLNMREFLRDDPRPVEKAEAAIRREGIEPKRTLIRGGTDGSRLTEMGLPTPNLFTGGRDYHSEREWLCVQEMGAACATLVHLVGLWAEPD